VYAKLGDMLRQGDIQAADDFLKEKRSDAKIQLAGGTFEKLPTLKKLADTFSIVSSFYTTIIQSPKEFISLTNSFEFDTKPHEGYSAAISSKLNQIGQNFSDIIAQLNIHGSCAYSGLRMSTQGSIDVNL
jgi:hypothetical protein